MESLYSLIHHVANPRPQKTMTDYIVKIAPLSDCLEQKNDPPPGNMVIRRDRSRLTDIYLGRLLGAVLVGN